MRYYILGTTIIISTIFVSGCWFKPIDDLANNKVEETIKQPECLAKLDIYRDDSVFKDKNFGDKIKVDDKRFSGLTLLDATKPKEYADGGGEKVGKLANLSDINYRDMAVYLVKNQILKTYVHLGSKVCLVDENKDKLDTLYVAHFIGTHEFCTNECETEDLDFRVMIEKDSGFIYLAK